MEFYEADAALGRSYLLAYESDDCFDCIHLGTADCRPYVEYLMAWFDMPSSGSDQELPTITEVCSNFSDSFAPGNIEEIDTTATQTFFGDI